MLFFIFILLIESMLFFLLYFSIINERVQSEIDNLLSRGISHRVVLEKNFDSLTIKHVALMESEAETMVVITDEHFNILQSSNKVSEGILEMIEKGKTIVFSNDGVVLDSKWKTSPYLATGSPIQLNESIKGYVFMFLSTGQLKQMIQSLTLQFSVVGGFATIISIITLFFLSRFITIPLLQMKKATEKLSEGKSELALDIYREDELGDLARSIQTLADDLERLKNDRSEFLSSISHELRTPLTYLMGYADILKRPNLSKEEHENYVAIIQEEASNLTRLVKDLFDLAKMDKNQFLIQKEEIQLCTYLQEIITRFKSAFEEKNMRLHLSCDKDIFISIDPVRLGQVMNNLIDNALKYTSSNTNVWISARRVGKQVMVEVIDEGDGIPLDEIPLLWDRLYRVDKSRSRLTGGSGLGLTIAKEIIERHGGNIEVNSVVGKGTTFTIYLKGE